MEQSQQWQWIPTHLSLAQFEQFVLPHLVTGRRGPVPKLSAHAIFNYIVRLLYPGCQWKELPIATNQDGCPEVHYTSIYRMFRYWQARGCLDQISTGSVAALHAADLLDTDVLHGDGTTTAARKGGDNLGFSGHKKVKGDKVVAFCDRHCNVIAPFEVAPGNRNESPMLRDALPRLARMPRAVGFSLRGSIISLGNPPTKKQ